MLRISRLTDYSTVIMAYLAAHGDCAHKAKDIAQHTRVALPTVSKVLKLLTRAGLLVAQRGAKGGYSLAMPAEQITLAQVINAIEGNIALTECGHQHGMCTMESLCAIRGNWRIINNAIQATLQKISLAEMTKPTLKLYDSSSFKQPY